MGRTVVSGGWLRDPLTGILYGATNAGIIEYDGQRWNLISTPAPARAVWISPNHRIWVGCKGDFGELKTDSLGRLVYKSYLGFLPVSLQKIGDISAVFGAGNDVYFIGSQAVAYLNSQELAPAPRTFSDKFIAGGGLSEWGGLGVFFGAGSGAPFAPGAQRSQRR
jgi:hypothetical protein